MLLYALHFYEAEFFQISSLHRKTENCQVFQFRLLTMKVTAKKVMTKFEKENLRKLYFGPSLSIFGEIRIFSQIYFRNILLFLDFYRYAKFQKITEE